MNTPSLIGMQIDQYKIESHIARGGMAEVYLATDVTLQRQVALKVMLSELAANQTATARFRREAEAVARLNHPNIIQIYTTGVTPDNRSYLAMQYVSGGTLQQKLAQLSRQGQQMSAGESLYLARQVAAALQVAHQQDIVHRDLKPSNILLHTNGEPVITDLGIAAMDSGASRLTQTGSVMGTPHYMSPEQALGQHVDSRSDIYSLGIILYEMLTGHVPFAADSPMAILHQQIYETPRALIQVRPGLSRSTYLTVDTCLQKEPDKRFQTAEQLAAALDHSLMSEGVKTPQAVTSYPTVKVSEQRRRWPIWAVIALAVMIVVISVGYILANSLDSDPSVVPEQAPDQSLPVVPDPPEQPVEPTASVAPTETALHDPGCSREEESIAYVGEDGNVCIGGIRILDLEAEADGCFEVSEISPSPNNEHFSIVLQCFEGDNNAFIFQADGSNKRRLTDEWDHINYEDYVWTSDGYFVYQRINSCCVEPPPDAPPPGVVWYEPETGQKMMPDFPSPLTKYQVLDVAVDDVLDIRSAAGVDNPIVGSIPYNEVGVEVIGLGILQETDIWIPIRYRDTTGWVNSSYIQLEGSEPLPVPTETPQISADVTADYLRASPIIDGSLDEWTGRLSYRSAYLVHQDDSWDGSDDIEAVWQLGWDNDYLYVAVAVEDNVHVQTTADTKIWQGDSVEIQFDTDLEGDYGTVLNSDDFQLNVSPGDFLSVPAAHHLWRSNDGGRYDWIRENSITISARDQGGAGYTVEMAIPWEDLALSPIPGKRIGFALNVSDNDGPGTAVQEVMKSTSELRNFTHPDSWGTLTLQE